MTSLLQVRPGEGRLVLSLTALMFLVSAGGAIGSPGIEALFYARFGVEFLPYLYIALGAVTFLTTLFLTAAFGRLPKRQLYTFLPLGLAFLLVVSRIVVTFDPHWFYPLLWLGFNLVWTLQGLLTWGLAGSLCDTRQAKRLFPLFAAGGIVGITLGGLSTRLLVDWFGSENLLLGWAFALFAAFVLVHGLTQRTEGLSKGSSRRGGRWIDDLQHGYRFVQRSSLLRWISLAAVLFSVLFFSLAFPFSKAIAARFPQEDAMAGFLGVFHGLTNGVAFLASLLLANRLFARVGIMGAMLIFPILYLIGFGVVAYTSTFAVIVVFRFVQLLWLLGIASTGYQAIFNLVPPSRRDQARALIDGVPGQAGVALSGLLLIIGEQQLRSEQLFLIGAGVAVVTSYVIWKARRAYAGALVEALRAGHPHIFYGEERPFGGLQQDASAVAVVVSGVSDPDPAVRRISAEILGSLPIPEATTALVNALQDPDPEVRAASLRALARSGSNTSILDVAGCLADPELEVRLAAVESLPQLAGYPPGWINLIRPMLDDPAPPVRAGAALALLQAGPDERARQVLLDLAGEQRPEVRAVAISALAEWGDPGHFDVAAAALLDPHPAVRRAAAAALPRFRAERGLEALISSLADEDPTVRQAVAGALGPMGSRALGRTLEALENPNLEEGALLALRRLLTRGRLPRLYTYAEKKAVLGIQLGQYWRNLDRWANADPRLDLLADSLRDAARRQAIRAFRALSLGGEAASVEVAIENLNSRDPAQVAYALETLEALADRKLIAPLLTLWDSSSASEIPADSGPHPSTAILRQLLRDPDPWLRACAALAAGCTDPAELNQQLAQVAEQDPDEIVRLTAQRTLDGGLSMDTLATLSPMERILFLRQVPLFADLPPAELKQVASIAGERFHTGGEVICRQGDPGDEMYIIVAGEVLVMLDTGEGESSEIARRTEGEYVGEMAIISREPRMASLIAAGDVRLLCIDRKAFEGILRERPETSLAVMRVLIQRLKEGQAPVSAMR